MASAAEQLAANLSLGTFSKATELKQRIWFTLTALIVYRIGTYIPIPGVDASVMAEMMQRPGGGLFVLHAPFSAEPRLQDLLKDAVVARGRLAGRRLEGGSFLAPDVSFDGQRVLFAGKQRREQPWQV